MQTACGDFAGTDAHVHFFSRRFFAAMGSQCGKTPEQVAETLGWSLPPEDPVELARAWATELDTHGVARAVLIASVAGDEASVEAAVAALAERVWGFFVVTAGEDG